jgi:hypothetical protein
MPSVFYTNPWMLSGLAALAVPVIIHLLLRRKKKRLRFSTLQFFVKQDEQSSRRRKLRNWLLLAMRLLLVALLVTAFARPFQPQGGAMPGAQQRRLAIFVLDRSASMLAVGTDGQRWSRAKNLMQKALGALDANDRAALVGCSSSTEVLSGFVPPAALGKIIAELQPAYGTSSLVEGLQQAVKLAAAGDQEAATTLYVVSDLQRSSCQNLGSCLIPQDLDVQVLSSGDFYSPNLSITDLQIDAREGAQPCLVVSSFCDEESIESNVELVIDGRVALSIPVSLKPGTATNVNLALPVLKPGWHDAQASLRNKDSLELDNTRYAAFFVPEPLRVLIVESRKTGRVFEQDSFFLSAALGPSENATNSVPSDFIVIQIAPEDLARRLSGSGAQLPCDVVVLPGLKDIPSGAGQALTRFVQAGGGLLLFLGEGVSANRYNSEFRGLMPAQLRSIEVAPDAASGWRIGEFDTNTPAFASFLLPDSGDLAIPQFYKRYSLTPAEGAAWPAYFEDGVPLMGAGVVGRGRVALVNSSADTSWNDWPKHKTFVPWLHGLGKQLALKDAHIHARGAMSLLAEDELEVNLGPEARKAQFVMQQPGGQKLALTADDLGRLHAPGQWAPGVYSVQDRDGREIQRLAVNIPPRESDLAAWRPLDWQQQLVRGQAPQRTSPSAILYDSKPGRKELWRLLLLAALGLLLLETIVANRSSA